MKIATIVGTRAQVVRSAVLTPALRAAGHSEVVVSIGERTRSEEATLVELRQSAPIRRLDVDPSDTGWMLLAITGVLFNDGPDAVLVSGDAPCALAGARAAAEAGIPVAHVEAGVRGCDAGAPEEAIRLAVDQISSWLFCAGDASATVLEREGPVGEILEVGDVLLDAVHAFSRAAHRRYPAVDSSPHVVAFVGRRENMATPRLERILAGLNGLRYKVHFLAGRNTRSRLATIGAKVGAHIRIQDEVSYMEMCSLVSSAHVVVTDSGALQREAYWHGVPCVTLRSNTEWTETVEAGANVLVDDDPVALDGAVRNAAMPKRRPELYGDGRAAGRVARAFARVRT